MAIRIARPVSGQLLAVVIVVPFVIERVPMPTGYQYTLHKGYPVCELADQSAHRLKPVRKPFRRPVLSMPRICFHVVASLPSLLSGLSKLLMSYCTAIVAVFDCTPPMVIATVTAAPGTTEVGTSTLI